MYCLYNTYSVNILKSFVRCVCGGKGFLQTIQLVSSQAQHFNTKADVRNSQYLINNSINNNSEKNTTEGSPNFFNDLKNRARNIDQWRDFIHILIKSLISIKT